MSLSLSLRLQPANPSLKRTPGGIRASAPAVPAPLSSTVGRQTCRLNLTEGKNRDLAINVLREAIKAVPAVRYALGIGGLIAAIALTQTFKIEPLVAFIGTIVMLVLMGVLIIFARMSGLAKSKLSLPAIVFTWFTLLLFMVVAVFLFTSVFLKWPLDLPWLEPAPKPSAVIDETQIDVVFSFAGETKEHAIGAMYESGVQVGKDYEKAAYWYKKGVEKNDAESMIDYAELLANGLGISTDEDKADELFLAAGQLGNVRGLYKAGQHYRDFGDYPKAIKYFKDAAVKGWPDSYAEIGSMFESGKLGSQLAGESLEWYEKGVEEGSVQSKHYLGVALIEGVNGKRDQLRGIRLFEEVAKINDYQQVDVVWWALGSFYGNSDSQLFDPVRSEKAYKLAAAKGQPCARTKVASIFLDKQPRNVEMAIDILQSGVRDKQPQSILFLARRLLSGEGITRDAQRAESLLKLGADLKDVDSMLVLADAYNSGVFGKENSIEAVKYFSMAAQNGSMDAEERLKLLMSGGYQCSASP
jgi:TPR repeat protein